MGASSVMYNITDNNTPLNNCKNLQIMSGTIAARKKIVTRSITQFKMS
jgi:ribosomal protein S18